MLLATSDKKYFNTDYSCLAIAKFNTIQVFNTTGFPSSL